MADDDKNNEDKAPEKKSKKKLFMIVGLVIILLIGGAGGAVWKLGLLGGSHKADNTPVAEHTTTLPIPAATANLDGGSGRTIYVKMVANVEFKGTEEMAVLQPKVPEIQDVFQTYLHESRPQDLKGSGFYRLKEAILRRLRIQMSPLNVTNVYITELLTQ